MAGAAARLDPESKTKVFSDGLLLLQSLGIPKEKLWATYFSGGFVRSKIVCPQNFPLDEDTFYLFRQFGIEEKKIVGCGADIAFVGLTSEDPYGGPRAHVYFDRGEKYSCGPDCQPEHSDVCQRFIELLVFITEYLEKEIVEGEERKYRFVAMNSGIPFVVIGCGIERLLWVICHLNNIYLVEPIQKIVQSITNLTSGSQQNYLQILKLAEYLKTVVFLIASGGKPGSKPNRRRQLRSLIIDLICLLDSMSIKDDKRLLDLVNSVITEYYEYPILANKEYSILETIKQYRHKVGLL
jgi:alanyl-tRNA synthetase